MPKPKVNLLLDSGAFSAWRRRVSIDVDAYADFILEHEHLVEKVVNLDVIPGSPGSRPSAATTAAAAERGWENLLYLRKRGVKAMPVFHEGEPLSWLDRMLGEGYDWIGLGAIARATSTRRREWLDEVFGYLCGSGGYPHVRVHGFGVTSPGIIWRYPWYSVDSMSWFLAAGYGSIFVPRLVDGSYDYFSPPYTIAVAAARPGKHPSAASTKYLGHYDTAGSARQHHVRKYVESLGLSVQDVRTDYTTRFLVCAAFFEEVTKRYTPRPFERSSRGFFSSTSGHGSGDVAWSKIRIFQGEPWSKNHAYALTKVGVRDRLLSYFVALTSKKPLDLDHYVATGLLPKTPIKRKKLKV